MNKLREFESQHLHEDQNYVENSKEKMKFSPIYMVTKGSQMGNVGMETGRVAPIPTPPRLLKIIFIFLILGYLLFTFFILPNVFLYKFLKKKTSITKLSNSLIKNKNTKYNIKFMFYLILLNLVVDQIGLLAQSMRPNSNINVLGKVSNMILNLYGI